MTAPANAVEPWLSVIVVGRNDDFGGDFNGRMMAAAKFNHGNLDAAGISHEYVFVEWNPIEGKPYLAEVIGEQLPWWHRRYVVDRKWHDRLSVNPRLGFMEFCAKNVGVRRAKGRFVLTTNTDIWLSREVLRALPSLRAGVLYRAARVDLRREIGYEDMTFTVLEHPESFLRSNVLTRDYYANAAGDFLLMNRQMYVDLRGFNEVFRESKIHKDANFCVHALRRGLPVEVLGLVYHLDHESSWNNVMHLYGPGHREAPFGRSDWQWDADYDNEPGWGLAEAPEDTLAPGVRFLRCP
jgi:hypothetical protein